MIQQEGFDSVSLSGLMQPGDWPRCHWRRVRTKTSALRLNDEVLSWSDLCTRVDQLVCGFAAQGIEEGDGVLLHAWSHPRALPVRSTLLQRGARVLPMSPQLPQPLFDTLILDLTLRFALGLEATITLPELNPLQMQSLPSNHAATWLLKCLSIMALTSGPAGLPKTAVHTCRAYLTDIQNVLSLMPLSAEGGWLLSLPLSHVSNQGILWRQLFARAQMTIRDK